MKKLFLATAATAALLACSAQAQVVSPTPTAPLNITTATTTEAIIGLAGQITFITSARLYAGGTDNVTISYGDPGCTNLVTLDGPYPLKDQGGISTGNGAATIYSAPKGKSICVVTDGAVKLGGGFSYQRF